MGVCWHFGRQRRMRKTLIHCYVIILRLGRGRIHCRWFVLDVCTINGQREISEVGCIGILEDADVIEED